MFTLWAQFLTTILYPTIKRQYGKKQWSGKPFQSQDIEFFKKGVLELHESFTSKRGLREGKYFSHPRFRSSYLAYFLPIQSLKFLQLFEMHKSAIQDLLPAKGPVQPLPLEAENSPDPLSVLDLGCGPATASLAFLFYLKSKYPSSIALPIEITLWDNQASVLKDAQHLLKETATWLGFTKLRYTVIHAPVSGSRLRQVAFSTKFQFILCGHLLNELSSAQASEFAVLAKVSPSTQILWVEPAFKGASQKLSHLRDHLTTLNAQLEIIGPCFHQESCPLTQGRDWCHFSPEIAATQKTFEGFSQAIGSIRTHLKFSYLWIKAGKTDSSQLSKPSSDLEIKWRVISDPIPDGKQKSILLCAPNRPKKIKLRPQEGMLKRGSVMRLSGPLPVAPHPIQKIKPSRGP